MDQDKLIIVGILAGVYIIVMPIILRLIPFLHKKLVIQKKMQKMTANEQARYKPNLLAPIWKERLSYTMKDKRDFSLTSGKKKKGKEPSSSKIQNRQMLLLIWAVGLLTVVVGAFLMNFYVLGAGYIIFFFAAGFGITASKDMIEARKKIMTRLYEIANSKLGIGAEYAENPGAVIRVLEWSDPLKPSKIEFDVPTTFAQEGEEGFLRQFNQVFGQETTWVPFDDKETGKPGWNYEDGIATFFAVPPLPTSAPWSAHYVVNPNVAWSYFPIALSTGGGIELANPDKNGEIENVIGFDLSGEQVGLAKKNGIKIGGEITTSPMCLTGDTLVLTQNGVISIKEIAELNEPVQVKSLNGSFEFLWNKMFGTKMTRINSEILELTFKDGSKVKCTPDHKWLLSYGTYVEAKDLLNLYVKGFGQEALQVVKIENAGFADVYDGEVENTHNFVVITDEKTQKGLVTSNCFIGGGTGGGKSLSVETMVKVV